MSTKKVNRSNLKAGVLAREFSLYVISFLVVVVVG